MNIEIPLKNLTLSPLNVRKAPPSVADQAELSASIFTHGLLENLIVRPTDGDHYEVLAGGRRLLAMQALVRDGEMRAGQLVACLVHEGNPQEISLAENIVRLSMHALDQFEAFAALAEQGLTVAEIANRFGNTEALVRQRLRLGRVAPEIREAYRTDDINLDTLMAFAVTEDNGQQLTVWEEVKDGHVYANQVRRLLTDEKIAATSKYVEFIGMGAYEAAGGTSMCDLFSKAENAAYLDDRDLVMRLVQEKLETAAETLKTEGWKWTQALLEISWKEIQKCKTVYPQNLEPTSELGVELKRLQKGLGFYEIVDEETGLSPEEEEKVAELEEKLESLEESLRAYTPEDLAQAGCMVSVDYNGEISIRRGLVLPEDQKPDADAPAKEVALYSAKLKEDLGNYRLEIAQQHLAQDFECAFDLMVFNLAQATLNRQYLSEKALNIQVEKTLPYDWAERSGTDGVELPAGIDIGWLELSPVEGMKALSAIPVDTKQRLFAHCTALSLQGRLSGGRGNDLFEAIGHRLGIDVAVHWRPTAANFFKRVTKARALEIAADVLGESWSKNHKGEKKGILAATLEANFNGNRTPGVTVEQATVASRWVPEGMGFPVVLDGPCTEATKVEAKVEAETGVPIPIQTPTPTSTLTPVPPSCINELPEAFCFPAAE